MSTPSARFVQDFGRPPELEAEAPGRVNLLGEHTDYNGGLVLPAALPLRTRVLLARRDDARVNAISLALSARGGYTLGAEEPSGDWLDYVKGVTTSLRRHGHLVRGFDVLVSTDIPLGSGLSSSAALEVALLRGLARLFNLSIDDLDLARYAQWGENNVVGAPVGLLDPIACHLADERSALFVNTRTLEHEKLPLPPDVELAVVDSGVRHAHASGGYRTRRAECERAARELGVSTLSDLGLADLPRILRLEAPLNHRARHVVTENARVRAGVDALRRGDARALGELFYASHASQRDDFEVSVPEIDVLIERARGRADVFGARLTGGGFGGSVVCLAVRGRALDAGKALAGENARLLIPREDDDP